MRREPSDLMMRDRVGRALNRQQIPEACVGRLSLYLRELTHLTSQGTGFVSSRWLAKQLGLTDAQVRRDFSYFGQFGTSGRGYQVLRLVEQLTAILGVSGRTWNVALAGVGNLGSALLAYRGFRERGFLFRVAVDADPRKVGQIVQGVPIAPAKDLAQLAQRHRIHIGVVAVPVQEAQTVADQLLRGGVRAIVNFAPIRIEVPPSVWLRNVDMAVELEGLTFHLARAENGVPSRVRRAGRHRKFPNGLAAPPPGDGLAHRAKPGA